MPIRFTPITVTMIARSTRNRATITLQHCDRDEQQVGAEEDELRQVDPPERRADAGAGREQANASGMRAATLRSARKAC